MLRMNLAKVFRHGATMPLLHPIIFGIVIIVEWGIMLLLRLSQGISSGCDHATPTPIFWILIIVGRGIMPLLRLSKVFLQGATMPPLHQILFFGIVIIVGRGHYASAST